MNMTYFVWFKPLKKLRQEKRGCDDTTTIIVSFVSIVFTDACSQNCSHRNGDEERKYTK